jgi:RNA recognition motif-containing protein
MLAGKFGRFGVVVSTRINRHPDTGVSQRSGFVEMQKAHGAQAANNGLNFDDYDGRLISVYRSVGHAPVNT